MRRWPNPVRDSGGRRDRRSAVISQVWGDARSGSFAAHAVQLAIFLQRELIAPPLHSRIFLGHLRKGPIEHGGVMLHHNENIGIVLQFFHFLLM